MFAQGYEANMCAQNLQFVSNGLHAETKRTLALLGRKILEPNVMKHEIPVNDDAAFTTYIVEDH